MIAVQHGLAAGLLQLLVAAVVLQAAPGGQTRGVTCGWAVGSQLEDLGGTGKDSPAFSPGQEGAEGREVNS